VAEMTSAEKAQETAHKALYAAIGAPARATKVVGDKWADATTRFTGRRDKAIKDLRAEFDAWVEEGEALVDRLQDRNMVEDITSRANVDQFQEQVGKLRHQLEDMLETWRANFLPERADAVKTAEKVEVVAKSAKKAAQPKAGDDLTAIDGIGPAFADRLNAAKITTWRGVTERSAAEIAEIAGTSEVRAAEWIAEAAQMAKKAPAKASAAK